MKLTRIKELLALLQIKEASRDATQAAKFAELSTEAAEHQVELTESALTETIKSLEDAEGDAAETSAKELAKLINDAVKGALPEGADAKSVADAVEKAFKEHGSKSFDAEKFSAAIGEKLKGLQVTPEALAKAVKDSIPDTSLKAADLEVVMDRFASTIRENSKMDHSAPDTSGSYFPVEHRTGNLSVGLKQLLNVCVASTSPETLANMKAEGREVPQHMNDGITAEQLAHAKSAGENTHRRMREEVSYGKALTTGGSGSGAELIPSDLSSELVNRMYLSSSVAAEFVTSEVVMPTPIFTMPLRTSRPNFFVGSEAPGSDPTESSPGTGELILNAKKLIGYTEYSYEADEDSIIAVLPMLLDNLAQGAADALEGALINGDTTGTHQDSDINAVSAHSAKLFKGLRKYALAGSLSLDMSTGGFNKANIIALRKKLKRWGVARVQDLMLIVGDQGYNDLVGLDDTLTFDKVGSTGASRILTGEASSVFGIRIVVSSQVREDTNAAGVYDGVTTTKGTCLLVHRPSWLMGVRRGFTVEVDVNKKRQINELVASFRRDFQPKETPAAATPFVALGYNIAN